MANKELPRILKNIDRINWYRQGVEGINWFIAIPYFCGMKIWGKDNVIIPWHGRYNEGYFNKDFEDNLAKKALLMAEKSPDILDAKFVKPWRNVSKEIDKKFAFMEKNLEKMSDRDLIKLKNDVIRLMYKMWQHSLVIENFDPSGSRLFDEFSRKHNVFLTKDYKDVILLPSVNSFMVEEFLDRLKIVDEIKLKYGSGTNLNDLVKYDKIRLLIKKHSEKYFWMENSWADAKRISELEFAKMIFDDLSKTEDLYRKRSEMLNHIDYLKRDKKEIIKKVKSNEMKNIIKFYTGLADMREERKRQVLRHHYHLYEMMKEFAKRMKIPVCDMENLSPQEITSMKLNKDILDAVQMRNIKFVAAGDKKGNPIHFYDSDVDMICDALARKFESAEIKGVVANKGNVKGFVKIVLGREDFKKVNKGDIVVAIMTRPEYISVMEKAAAFITDEGGTTCHAAIVARELKKPCIVGTQNATLVLKDGDLVELDTDKGIVRKIK